MLDYFTTGIDYSLPGNGGPECFNFISVPRRVFEGLVALAVCSTAVFLGFRWLKPVPKVETEVPNVYSPARIALLVAMTFAYALEVGYKLATKQFVFVLNPCHQLCVIQIILLAWPSTSRLLTYLYRCNLYWLHGPIMAVIFPVTNTLFLPGEVFTYWFEHAMLLIIPFYLLRRGGNLCTVESLMDWSWPLMAYGLWGLYHFVVLELVAVFSLANLNSMLCPAISDPFYGSNWRLWALGHQFILNLVSGKLFGLLGVSESRVTKKIED